MSRKPTKGQRALYALLQTNRGHEVASAQILAASGWQEETLRVQLSNGRFAPFLKPTATADKYRVTIAEDTGLPAFCAAISQSEANRRGPGTEYQPFPVQAIDDLERLTRERAGLTAKSNQVSRDAVQRKIAKVVADLRQHPTPSVGHEVLGARLIESIGKGAFGTVWEAQRRDTGELIAIKMFDHDRLGLETALYHFRRGVRAMEHLNATTARPATVIRLLEVEESRLAFSMELVAGGDLSSGATHGWTPERKLKLFAEICTSVEFAHANKIIHRDIKPKNIVLHRDGAPVLTDFDISDLVFAKTQSSGVPGHIAYAAPEELEGKAETGSVLGDVYSLGRLLYFLFAETDPPILRESIVDVETLRESTSDVIAFAIQRATLGDPKGRYVSVSQFREDVCGQLPGKLALAHAAAEAEKLAVSARTHAKRGDFDTAVLQIDAALKALPRDDGPRRTKWTSERLAWSAATGDFNAGRASLIRWIPAKLRRPWVVVGGALLLTLVGGVLVRLLSSRSPDATEPTTAVAGRDDADGSLVAASTADADVSEVDAADVFEVDAAPSGGLTTVVDEPEVAASDRVVHRPSDDALSRTCRERHDGAACYHAAVAFAEAENNDAAVTYFDLACDASVPDACVLLGRAFSRRQLGQRQDDDRARGYYESGCRLRSGPACEALGTFLENGRGGDRDAVTARAHYLHACADYQFWLACQDLGRVFTHGIGGDRDPVLAARYRRLATELRPSGA